MEKNKLSVLVLDDEPAVTKLIQLSLRSTGWNLTITHDAQEAVTLADQQRPDVILCDAALPQYSGPQVIQALKEYPATSRIPVVLMTGLADASMFSHVPWAGFLAKPFTANELREAIKAAVRVAASQSRQDS